MFQSIKEYIRVKNVLAILLLTVIALSGAVYHLRAQNANLSRIVKEQGEQLVEKNKEIVRLNNLKDSEVKACFDYKRQYEEINDMYDSLIAEYDYLTSADCPPIVNQGESDDQNSNDQSSDAARIVLCKAGLAEDHLCNTP